MVFEEYVVGGSEFVAKYVPLNKKCEIESNIATFPLF